MPYTGPRPSRQGGLYFAHLMIRVDGGQVYRITGAGRTRRRRSARWPGPPAGRASGPSGFPVGRPLRRQLVPG